MSGYTPRLIAQWSAGRLVQSQWTYRLIEVSDEVYLLQVQLSDLSFVPAIGHFQARRVAEGLIEEDKMRVRAELDAYDEYGLRQEREEKVLRGEFGNERERREA